MAKTLEQLLSERIETPPYLVWPILPLYGKLFLYAPSDHYKSMLLSNILYDLAEARPILGCSTYLPKRNYVSLYVEQENGPYACRERFGRIHAERGGMVAPENIIIESQNRLIKLDTPEGFGMLDHLCNTYHPDILALDPLRKFHRHKENDNDDATLVVDMMDKLIEKHHVTIIIAHHQGHIDPQYGNKNTHMRGASVWHDEAATAIKVARNSRNREHITLEIEKTRHGPPQPNIDLAFLPDSFTFRNLKEKQA